MSDELKIVLEDVKEKFDLVIEAVNGVNERLDRHEQVEEERFQRIEDRLIFLQKDFNGHRENTELHAVKKKKKSFLKRCNSGFRMVSLMPYITLLTEWTYSLFSSLLR